MLGRRKKGTNGDFSSNVDLASTANSSSSNDPPHDTASSSSSSSSRAFNFLIERARGAVGLGAKERTRTTSEGGGRLSPGAPTGGLSPGTSSSSSYGSSPTRHFFARASTDDLSLPRQQTQPQQQQHQQGRNAGGGHRLPMSASMQELPKSNTFFRRQPTTSTPARPGWLSIEAARGARSPPSPLMQEEAGPTASFGREYGTGRDEQLRAERMGMAGDPVSHDSFDCRVSIF